MAFKMSRRSPLAVQVSNVRAGLAEQLGLPASSSWRQISRKAREKYDARELGEAEYERILAALREEGSM